MTKATAMTLAATLAVGLGLVVVYLVRSDANIRAAPGAAATANESPSEPPSAVETSPPPLAPPSAGVPRAAVLEASPPAKAATPLDEASLMAELRGLGPSDPTATLELARQGNARFPDSANAPERSSILIHALASLGQAAEARGEAEAVVNRYPDSSWVREIESFTGAHRHRSVQLGPDGGIEFY